MAIVSDARLKHLSGPENKCPYCAQDERIRELEAIVQRFVVFDPYPDSTLTKDARALLATQDRREEHE